jgi:hypothetical protein
MASVALGETHRTTSFGYIGSSSHRDGGLGELRGKRWHPTLGYRVVRVSRLRFTRTFGEWGGNCSYY